MKEKWLSAALCLGCVALTAAEIAPSEVKEEKPAVAEVQTEKPAADPLAAFPEVLATGKGVSVTKTQVLKALLEQIPGGKLPDLSADQWGKALYYQSRMQLQMQLLMKKVKEEKFSPSDEEVFAFVKKALAAQPQIVQILAMQQKSIDDGVKEILARPGFREQVVGDMFLEKQFGDVVIDDAAAKKFYEENLDRIARPADPENALRASHILVMVNKATATDADKKAARDKIEAALEKVKADPASFEKVAAEVSDCGSARQGGDLGAFMPGQMVPEFEKALVALKDGEISGIVETQFGYHVIRRNALLKKTVPPFEEVKGQIVNVLTTREKMQRMEAFFEKLEKEAEVRFAIPEPKQN